MMTPELETMPEHTRRVWVLWEDQTWEERLVILPNRQADLDTFRSMEEFGSAVHVMDWDSADPSDYGEIVDKYGKVIGSYGI